jgi:hypothetical protein
MYSIVSNIHSNGKLEYRHRKNLCVTFHFIPQFTITYSLDTAVKVIWIVPYKIFAETHTVLS